MRHAVCLPVSVAIGLGVLGCAATGPTGRELISAMPSDIESVMVLEAAPLLRDTCALKRDFQGYFGVADPNTPPSDEPARDVVSSVGDSNLDRVVFGQLVALKPLRRALGGADFAPPQGIGIGTFRYLTVWVTAESNTPVRRAIERREGLVGEVEALKLDDCEAYRSTVEIWFSGQDKEKRDVYVVFPTEHVTVVAHAREHATHIAHALRTRSEQPVVPQRWQAAARGLDLDAPLVILRKFTKPTQTILKRDPADPTSEPVAVPFDGFGMTADAGPSVKFHLRVNTSQPDLAVYYFHANTFHGGFSRPIWTWMKQNDAEGFAGEVRFSSAGAQSYQEGLGALITLTLFGVLIAI